MGWEIRKKLLSRQGIEIVSYSNGQAAVSNVQLLVNMVKMLFDSPFFAVILSRTLCVGRLREGQVWAFDNFVRVVHGLL